MDFNILPSTVNRVRVTFGNSAPHLLNTSIRWEQSVCVRCFPQNESQLRQPKLDGEDAKKESEYAATLTPTQIVGRLWHIFGAFDSFILKCEPLIRVKLIRDRYMCVDDPPEQTRLRHHSRAAAKHRHPWSHADLAEDVRVRHGRHFQHR
jgi:hypothetical protein